MEICADTENNMNVRTWLPLHPYHNDNQAARSGISVAGPISGGRVVVTFRDSAHL